jgi:hypothetical protein
MSFSRFPVTIEEGSSLSLSLHRVEATTLPVLDLKSKGIDKWFEPHMGSMMSNRERALRKHKQLDPFTSVKDSIHSIFVRAAGTQLGAAYRVFQLRDDPTQRSDTVFFVNSIKFDIYSHTLICEAYLLTLTPSLLQRLGMALNRLGTVVDIVLVEGEMKLWKHLIPALAERCRTWKHGPNCEYRAHNQVPLTEEMEMDPMCSCGRGKDVDGMGKEAAWKPLAPYVTKIALSPLFAVSYLERVGREMKDSRCHVCRGKGKPKMQTCSGCQKTRYCSRECQKKDWASHKKRCKGPN